MTAGLLVLGYAASQWFYFQGKSADYAKAVDTPAIQSLSLILLLAMIVLGLIPVKDPQGAK